METYEPLFSQVSWSLYGTSAILRFQKELGEPIPHELPGRRSSSVAAYFIVNLHKTKTMCNSITTAVHRLRMRARFTASKDIDTAIDVANSFFNNVVKLHCLPILLYQIVTQRLSPTSGIRWRSFENSASKCRQADPRKQMEPLRIWTHGWKSFKIFL